MAAEHDPELGLKLPLRWLRSGEPDAALLLAIPVGMLAALVTSVFRLAIEWLDAWLFGSRADITMVIAQLAWYWRSMMPALGGCLQACCCGGRSAARRKSGGRRITGEDRGNRLDRGFGGGWGHLHAFPNLDSKILLGVVTKREMLGYAKLLRS